MGAWSHCARTCGLVHRRSGAVSDDVPLARTPGTLTAPVRAGVASRWWEVYLACCLAGVLALPLIVGGDESMGQRFVAVSLLVGMGIWYTVLGHPLLCGTAPRRWLGYVLQAGLYLLYVPLIALVDGSSFILFGL